MRSAGHSRTFGRPRGAGFTFALLALLVSGATFAAAVAADAQDTAIRKLPYPSVPPRPAPPGAGWAGIDFRQPGEQLLTGPVVNTSQKHGNQTESTIAINPTNPMNIVIFSNEDQVNATFRAYSFDGGLTWTKGDINAGACCDGQAVFDSFGNLFLVYIGNGVSSIDLVMSTDGGVTFGTPIALYTGSPDQPSIAAGHGSLWVDWNQGGHMVARGAHVTGLGGLGTFGPAQTIPGATGSFGGITVGPGPGGGMVMVTYQNPYNDQGPSNIYVNIDPDGLGFLNFGNPILVTSTNVGGFDYIPAQNDRSIDAEAGLVWDNTGGPHQGRAYLIYTDEVVNESNDTDIEVRTSDDNGQTWTAPVRVNDDPSSPIRSQFLPYIALDPTTGAVAAGWHDCRNDNGVPGSGGTNTTPNDDAEYYASYSLDGGVTWAPNVQMSQGFSNARDSGNGIDFGDFVGTTAYGGVFRPSWADNSNSTGDNPDGTLRQFDLYTSSLDIPTVPTSVAAPPEGAGHGNAPARLALSAPAPNPSSGGITFSYGLPAEGRVQLTLHDVQGREVARLLDAREAAGWHDMSWDGKTAPGQSLAPGVYFVRAQGAGDSQVRRVVVLK